jgi:aryl-alcohol dehydrogenase-like predicted oxidoreductase
LQAAEQLGLPRITSIQNSYSLLVRGSFETDLAEVCAARQANVGLLAYSPLAGGALTGKYIEGGPDTGKARLNLFQGEPQRAKGRRVGRREVVLAAAAAKRVGRDCA